MESNSEMKDKKKIIAEGERFFLTGNNKQFTGNINTDVEKSIDIKNNNKKNNRNKKKTVVCKEKSNKKVIHDKDKFDEDYYLNPYNNNNYYLKNFGSNVNKKEVDVSVENDQLREIAEVNDVMNEANRVEKNYQPMMGGKEDFFVNNFSELREEINGLKERINNINIGGYYSVDENKMISTPILGKYVFVNELSENVQDLIKNSSSNDKLQELMEKAKKKLSEKKKEEEEKKENPEDSSSNELSSSEDEDSKTKINNNEPSMGKDNINFNVVSEKNSFFDQ